MLLGAAPKAALAAGSRDAVDARLLCAINRSRVLVVPDRGPILRAHSPLTREVYSDDRMTKASSHLILQEALRPLSIARAIWKQKFALITLWVVLSVVAALVVYRLPPVYRAETVILVDSQAIPEKFVNSAVSADLREQLANLSQQVLSNARLWKIIEKFDLYPDARRHLSIQEVVEQMRADLQVRVEDGWSPDRAAAFRVSYQGPDPAIGARVVNQLGALFIDENVRTREMSAEGTEEFIQGQLGHAKEALEEQEKHIAEFKLQYNGELPEQQGELTASLSQLSLQLQGNQEATSRVNSSQATLQGDIRVAQAIAEMSKRIQKSELAEAAQETSDSGSGEPEDVLKAMQAELATLLTKYTDSYPRVRVLRASIARLKLLEQKQQLAAQLDPDHVESLKMQLAAVERELKERSEEHQKLLQQIQSTNARLSRIPIREQELAALTRDYEISRTNYQSLLDKLNAAKMSSDMEHRQKAERFTILEPAHVPAKPVKPNRPLLLEIGELLALAGAVAVGLVLEVRKNCVLGEWELPDQTLIYGRVPSMCGKQRASVRLRVQPSGPMDSIFRLLTPVRNHDADRAVGQPLPQNRLIATTVDAGDRGPAFGLHPSLAIGARIGRTVRSVSSESPALCLHNLEPRALEQYRIARTRIERDPANPKLVAVSSACPGDGKTISAINLATIWAMRGDLRILLVEADFRHSSVAGMLGIAARPGLSDVLSGTCELSDAIVVIEQLPTLCVLPAGSHNTRITELLAGPAWNTMCKTFREQFDHTVFDTPPVGPVADFELIEKNSDGVILVVRPDHTDRSLLRIAQGLVLPDKFMGVLLNDVKDWFLWKTSSSNYGYPAELS